jgi:hypothetical protein
LGETAETAARGLRVALEMIVGWIRRVRLDMANERLRRLVPVMRIHGFEYERHKFEERVASGLDSIDSTRREIGRILAAAPASLQTLARAEAPQAVHVIHREMVLSALFHRECWNDDNNNDGGNGEEEERIPSILRLDITRFDSMREEMRYLIQRVLPKDDADASRLMPSVLAEEEEGMVCRREMERTMQELVAEAFHGRIAHPAEAEAYPRYRIAFGSEMHGSSILERVFALVECLTGVAALNRSVHHDLIQRLVREEAWLIP